MNKVAYAILLIIGVSLLVMPMSVPRFKSDAAYSVLNTEWNGLSSFGKLLYKSGEITPVLVPYDSLGLGKMNGTLIVVGPDVDFSQREIEQVRAFLEGGGTLILADDFGTGNELLAGLGLPQRFSKKPVTGLTYLKNYEFPVTREITDDALSTGVNYLMMSRPAVILNAQNPAVYTSNASMLNGEYGAFPLLDVVSYGKGRVILISDPDIFTNALFPQNEPFLRNLIGSLPEKTFYIDEAHHADFNPYSTGTIVIRRAVNRELVFYYVLFIAALAFFIESGLFGLLLDKLFALLGRFFREERQGLDEIISRLEESGLDGDKLKKILHEIETGSKLGGGHGR